MATHHETTLTANVDRIRVDPWLLCECGLGPVDARLLDSMMQLVRVRCRDYLAVPADSIKDLKPLMTIVGGKIVYDAKKP